jgi:putative ABC transport system permease protein
MLLENVRQGIGSIKSQKLRAVITASIIAIGITALVGILTSIDAMGDAITQTMTRFGARTFTITNSISIAKYGRKQNYQDLTYAQARQFRSMNKEASLVTFSINANFNSKLHYESAETNPNIRVLGVDEHYLSVSSFEISEGRNFTSEDIYMGLPWVVLGSDVFIQLFGPHVSETHALGKEVSVDGIPFKIIGTLKKKGSSFGMSGGDRQVLIGIEKVRQVFPKSQDNVTITVLSSTVNKIDEEISNATQLLRRIRRLKPEDDPNFTLTRSDALENDVKQELAMVKAVGLLIGIITLLGAAVSLMNIMLVSVTERTKEIGIRKSLGASSNSIRNQFLVEALFICQLGGMAGIVLGIVLGNAVGVMLGGSFVAPWFWIITAFLISMFVGLIAGLDPALKAAKLSPIEALRHEG